MSFPARLAFVLVALAALGPIRDAHAKAVKPSDYLIPDALPPITDAEKALASIASAPGAPAVVLLDAEQTQWTPESVRRLIFRRIKILTEAGVHDYGDYTKGWWGKVRPGALSARTVLADGSVIDATDAIRVTTSEDPDSLEITLAFPRVQVGAILDVLLEVRADSLRIDEWIVQEEIPVLQSRFLMAPRTGRRYRSALARMTPESVETAEFNVGSERMYAWVFRDVPPLPDVPNRPPVSDIAGKLVLMYEGYSYGSVNIPYASGWKALIGAHRDHYESWMRRKHGQVDALALQAAAAATTPRDKAEAIRVALRDRMAVVYFADGPVAESPDEALAAARGSSADLALLEITGLRAVGVDAHPAGIRRRSSGSLPPEVPAPNLLDDMLVVLPGAADGGKDLVFSPAADQPVDRPDVERVGIYAVPYRKGATEPFWIPDIDAGLNGVARDTTLALGADGRISGQVTCTVRGFAAAEWRNELLALTEEQRTEWIEDQLDDESPSLQVGAIVVEDLDAPAMPLVVTAAFTAESEATKAGTRVLFNPFLFERVRTEDWAAEKREVDVYLGRPSEHSDSVVITIPPGVAQVQLPGPLKLEAGAVGSYVIDYSGEGTTLRASRRLKLGQVLFPAASYPPLRDWFRDMAKGDDQALVLTLAEP